MKTIRAIVLVFAALLTTSAFADNWACDYYLPQCPEKASTFEKEANAITDSNIGIERTKKLFELTERMYPKDKTLLDMFKQNIALWSVANQSTASKDEKNAAMQLNGILMEDVIKDRFQMANAFMDADREYQRQQQARSNAGNVAATATMLNGIGRAFNNSFGQSITPPPQVCNYYGGTRYCF